MIINTDGSNKFSKVPNMVKRGFNQTPSDIKDKILASQIAYKKQAQIMKNKENNLDNTLNAASKVESLKKINNEFKGD